MQIITVDELLVETARAYPVLYDKAINGCKDQNKKSLAWQNIAQKTSFFFSGKNQTVDVINFCSTHFLQRSLVYMTKH